MRVVAIVGYSESGKTRLAVRLIGALKGRGLRVAAVKRCSHGFSLDTEGKDTADFTRAGADGVAMISPEGWAALGRDRDADASRLARRLFPTADIVLVEGGKEVRGTAKIEVLRGAAKSPLSPPDELLAVVSDGPVAGVSAPVMRPDEIEEIAGLILAQKEGEMAEIKLEVDGQEINLNAFVQTFIEKTVIGMVTALTGIDPDPRRIRLEIDRTGNEPQGVAQP